jgi:hypothetical protein
MHHQKLLKTDLTEDERDYIKTVISLAIHRVK